MPKASAVASGLLLLLLHAAGARTDDVTPGGMPLPMSLADLAAAAGLHRDDPATLDRRRRLSFASPGPAARWRAAGTLSRRARGRRRERRPHSSSADPRCGATVCSAWRSPTPASPRRHWPRPAALIYHGLLVLDAEPLAWIEANPAVLDASRKKHGATAVFAEHPR